MNIFIGSSGEAKDLLLKIAGIVEECRKTPVRWDQRPSVFAAGKFTLESLEELVEKENIGAAIFICTSDDKVWFRDKEVGAPRDNVIFEHGLFMGKLGRTRSIIIKCGDVKLPTDLSGLTYIDFSEGRRNSGEIELRNWLNHLPEQTLCPKAEDCNVLMLPRKKLHEVSSNDHRLHISDGLYRQIRFIRIMNFASNLIINPEMAEIGHIASSDILLSDAIVRIMKETEATVELVLTEPNKYNVKDLDTKIANRRAGSCADALYSALATLYRNFSTDTIYATRWKSRPRLFFFYLMKTSMPFGIFNVEFIGEASRYNHVKVDLYSAALKTEDDRRSFVIWQTQDPENYKFFVDNFNNIKNNEGLCKQPRLDELRKIVEKSGYSFGG